MTVESRNLLARIDAGAIAHNCRLLRGLVPAGCRMCVAVKSNAYGHGVETVLPGLRAADVEMLCVATIDEARELVDLEWQGGILLLGSELSVYEGAVQGEIARWLVENKVRVTAASASDIRALAAAAKAVDQPAQIHLMLDSGMCRMGLARQELLPLVDLVLGEQGLELEGLYTHLATADGEDKSFARLQMERFASLVSELGERGVTVPVLHCANSGATIDLPESHFNMVRPGISVYGYHPGDWMHNRPDLRPAMQVLSFLTLVKRIPEGSLVGYGSTYRAERDMTIGVVPIGYGDGYDRRLSNTGAMDIEGCAVPVIGRVSMDLTLVDLSPLVAAGMAPAPGQQVTVISDVRERANSVESIARLLGTIPYEVVTRLGGRVKRVGRAGLGRGSAL